MRFFFNVSGPDEVVRDAQGAEAVDLDEARREAIEAIRELWREAPEIMEGWMDHTLEILDAAGSRLAVLDLGFLVRSLGLGAGALPFA